MRKIPIYNINAEIVGEEEIEIENEKINKDVLYYYVNAYLTNQRKGTASTKTRGDVSGGGKKPWRQKGTGRARVGSIRNPIWKGGGVVFGPKPKEYKVRLPKKIKRMALIEAIKDKIIEDRFLLIEMSNLNEIKTKNVYNFLKKIGSNKEKILFILNKGDVNKEVIIKSIRNIDTIEYDYSDKINAYEILKVDKVFLDDKNIFEVIKKTLEKENGS
ncbi:MAG TPA: 50S ribosomal protein L4 [Candidatus Ratteibacteria bacterium]|nr:50S ribosomal protein L4 [Candidatus Ratteibacteria bacterium]